MNYVAYDKRSGKERRLQDLKRRGSWGGLCPVTRRKESGKLYSRARAKQETRQQRRALQDFE